MTSFGDCAEAGSEIVKAIMTAKTRTQCVIVAVPTHVDRRGQSVGHVVKGGHRGDVPDVAVVEAGAPETLAVLFLDFPRIGGELHREIQHRTLALAQPRGPVIHHHHLAEHGIAELAHRVAVRREAIEAVVLR